MRLKFLRFSRDTTTRRREDDGTTASGFEDDRLHQSVKNGFVKKDTRDDDDDDDADADDRGVSVQTKRGHESEASRDGDVCVRATGRGVRDGRGTPGIV